MDDIIPRWSWSYGNKPHVVYARERLDRGRAIEVRYSDPDKPGRDKRRKYFLDVSLTVRNAKGKIDRVLEREVQDAVKQINARLITGQQAKPPVLAMDRSELTLAEGFRKVLHPRTGKYTDPNSRHVVGNIRPRSATAINVLHTELRRTSDLPPTWVTFRPSHARLIWRALARTYKEHGTGGVRMAEQVVDTIYSAAAWLRQEDLIPLDAAMPQPKWRKQLKEEWQEITDKIVKPLRPRHSRDEMRRIFDVLSDPRTSIDPRIRLAIELGAELRVGQVLETKRSQLAVPDVDATCYESLYSGDLSRPEPAGVLGSVEIRGRGKKGGEVIVLTPEQRRAVDVGLTGYLRDYEAVYVGDGSDYYLFPAKKLVRGVARATFPPVHVERGAALKWFKALEKGAQVKSVKGRGWYGIRRTSTDVAPEYSSDARELNSLGGWSDSETREGIYQDRAQVPLKARASAVRRASRAGVGRNIPQTAAGNGTSSTDLEALAKQLTPEQMARLIALTSRKTERNGRSVVPKVGPSKNIPGPMFIEGNHEARIPTLADALNSIDVGASDFVKPSRVATYAQAGKARAPNSEDEFGAQRLKRVKGFEPSTSSLGSWRSTN